MVGRIEVTQGNIVDQPVTALVTAANEQLIGGGGVDGAIHSAAGPGLLAASRALAPCPAGSARITPAFNLDAKYVIHAVGPVFRGGQYGEARQLESVYRSVMQLCLDGRIDSVALPCISTGAFSYPRSQAATIAFDTVTRWIGQFELPRKVVFCCFDDDDLKIYLELLDR